MIVCPSCGRESSDDAEFCARCGTSLVLPREAREERTVVSIVFADLGGSTARSEQLDPEDVREATSIEGDLALLDGFVAVQTLGRGPDVAPLLDKASVRTQWSTREQRF